MVDLNSFEHVCECFYKGEKYAVRDNGAVFRYGRTNKRSRRADNTWTFGKVNTRTGYLEIASVRIHRIVATAFHGEPPTKQHVVDHIDTNKQNNRPDNLRWVTRLENIILNPITARRIELVCGSIEAFLEDPSKFRDQFPEPNYNWMCTVSKEDANASKERLLMWAKSDQPLQGGSLGDWIFNRDLPNPLDDFHEPTIDYIKSLTPNAVQVAHNWKTPTEFPCCPQENIHNPLAVYFKNLNAGNVFARNQYMSSIIESFAISQDETNLWVMCKSEEANPIKPYSLSEVSYQDGEFIHNSLGTFFKEEGAKKQFTLVQGIEWTGGDSIDDYC